MKPVFLGVVVAVLLAAAPAQAHKVIASVFRSGSNVEGEVGFSNGDMAANQLVEVFDGSGIKIGETRTDADGFFTFTPTQPVTHVFRANLGAGHVAEVTMDASDIAAILGKAVLSDPVPEQSSPTEESEGTSSVPTVVVAALTAAEKDAIAEAVRDEVRPLRREIAAYKEHNDLQSILGGIGYIVGLFGLGFYLAARRKMKA